MTFRVTSSWVPLGVLLMTLSCRSLDRFDTKNDAAFCGQLVSAYAFNDGFVPDVKQGEPKLQLSMKLTLDTSQLSTFSDDRATQVGALTSNDSELGLCAAGGQALFESSPVRGIPQVDHDTIST